MAKQKASEPETPEAAAKAPEGAPAKPKKAKEPKEVKERSAKATPEASATSPGAPAPAPASTSPSAQTSEKKKGKQPGIPPTRGKKLRAQMKAVRSKIAKEGSMPIKKAISLLKQSKRAKFDETVEIHMSLGIDTTQNDQMVRGSVPLPHGIGKVTRVVVFCQGDNIAKAKDAGADFAGSDDLIKKIQGGWLDFDVALATQDMMGVVSRLGKVLGPRGLMPTPKAGTVIPASADVAAGVKEFKAGKVEYRADKGGNVHAGVGKLSFDEDKLFANVTTFVEQIRAVKPSGVKGNYVKSITLSATMSPGIPVSV
jgi:large subunit ribosomal protein L1